MWCSASYTTLAGSLLKSLSSELGMSSTRAFRCIKDAVHPNSLLKQCSSHHLLNYSYIKPFSSTSYHRNELDVTPSSSTSSNTPPPTISSINTLSKSLSIHSLAPKESLTVKITEGESDPSSSVSTPLRDECLKFLTGKEGIIRAMLRKHDLMKFNEQQLRVMKQILTEKD